MNRNRHTALALAVIGVMTSQYAVAEKKESNVQSIERVEVVGTTTNTEVTPQDLEKFQANDLADIFRLVPSVSVGGSLGIAQKVYIRGLEDTLLNVTVDGAPQTGTLFHHIGRVSVDPDLLKEVEVQAGAGEATAGAGAIGGAIRFKTKNVDDLLAAQENFGGNVKASYFSNAGHKFSGSLYGRLNENWGVLGSYVSIDRDNMEDGNGAELPGTNPEQSIGFLKINGDISEQQQLSVSYEKRDEEGEFAQRPNWTPRETYTFYPVKTERETIVLNHTYQTGDLLNLETSIYTTQANIVQDVFDRWGKYGGELSSTGFDLRNTSRVGEHNFVYGIEHRSDEVESGAQESGDTATTKEKGKVTGVYIQDHWQITPALLLSAGVRFDQYDLDLVTYKASTDSSGFSPNLGLQYSFNDNWLLNLGYAQAMRGKEVGDAFTIEAGESTLSPSLDAEEVDNAELGLTYQDEHWHIVASVYKSEIDDVILDQLGRGTYYENVGTLSTDGVELKVGYWIDDIQIVANYSNSDADLNGLPVVGYEHNGLANKRGDTWGFNVNYSLSDTIELGWNFTRVSALNNISVLHRAVEIGWIDQTQTIDKPSYQVHDIFVQWQPNDNVSVNLSVQNLFDEHYRDHSSVGDYTHIPGWEIVEGLYEAGRDIRFSVSYSF